MPNKLKTLCFEDKSDTLFGKTITHAKAEYDIRITQIATQGHPYNPASRFCLLSKLMCYKSEATLS